MSELELRLHKAAATDLAVMHALLVVCGEHLYRQTGLRHWYPFRTYEQWSQRLDAEQVYAVYAGDHLAGTFNLNPMPRPYYQDSLWRDPAAKAAYVSGVGVLPSYQRRGIGRWMMAQAERLAAEAGNAAIRFDIVLADEALVHFCDGLGYARRGTISMAQWRLNDVLCYDAGGLRTRLTLPGGGQIDYGYNARGQLTHLTDSDGQTSAFVYDRVGRHTGSERANGLTSRYQHDPAGRLRLLRHRVGNKLLASFQFEVDGRGNRVNAREVLARPATVTTTIDRNHASVSTTGTWSDTGGFRRTTEFSARLSLTLSGQEVRLVVGTGPDHGLCDVYVDGSLWETYDGYSVAAGERSLPFYLDKGGSHSLELRNRPDKRGLSTGHVVRFKQVDVLATSYDQQTLVYAYDALARLRQAQYYSGVGVLGSPFRQYDYAFDLAGNRTQQMVTVGGTPTVTNYTYNAANQLIQAGSANLTYDSNGNMLNDGVNSYTWDRANRLLSMGGASYVYDGEGRRVKQTVGATVTKYLLDLQPGLSAVLSQDVGGSVTRYVHGVRGIHAQKDASGNWEYMLQDGLGSVRAVADANADILWSTNYDPFGVNFGNVGTAQTNYGFTGEETDGSGLLDLRARRYASALGVFASLDPFEGVAIDAMSLNGYGYVAGNPINLVDPEGNDPLRTVDCSRRKSELSADDLTKCNYGAWLLRLYPESGSLDYWLRFSGDSLRELFWKRNDGEDYAFVPLDFVTNTKKERLSIETLRQQEAIFNRPLAFAEILAMVMSSELSGILATNAKIEGVNGTELSAAGKTIEEFKGDIREASLRQFHGQCRRDATNTGSCAADRLIGSYLSGIQGWYDNAAGLSNYVGWLEYARDVVQRKGSGGQCDAPYTWGNLPSEEIPLDPPVIGQAHIIDWVNHRSGKYKYFALQEPAWRICEGQARSVESLLVRYNPCYKRLVLV